MRIRDWSSDVCVAVLLIVSLPITGLSFCLTLLLLSASADNLYVLLCVTAMVAVVLGMGIPTVGVYVILATLAAPALVEAGISAIQAHMFVMYFGMLSMITPPVEIGRASCRERVCQYV